MLQRHPPAHEYKKAVSCTSYQWAGINLELKLGYLINKLNQTTPGIFTIFKPTVSLQLPSLKCVSQTPTPAPAPSR